MRVLYSTIALLGFLLLLFGMERQRRLVNVDMRRMDQSAYMRNARRMAQSHFRDLGDRNRTPLHPVMMAVFYREDMSNDDLFDLGKRLGEVVAVVALLGFFAVLKRYSRLPDALAATLVAALTVFAYKAPYVRADVLFYGLFFLLFASMVETIARPRLGIAAAAGLSAGLAYLAKGSVPPAVGLGFAFLSAMFIRNLYARLRGPHDPDSPARLSWRSTVAPLYCGLVFVFVFLLTVFPYIRDTKAIYGRYFYNVSSTFYMWYDSWEEAERGTKAHGDRRGWPDTPEDQIPSMRKYLREHSTRQIVSRVARGTRMTWRRTWHSYGYMPFVSFYLICALAIALQSPRGFYRWVSRPRNRMLALFASAFFGGYSLAYVWYTPIGGGTRFILSLLLPALFVFVRFLAHAQKENWPLLRLPGRRIPASWVSPAVLIALLIYAAFIFPTRVSTMFGGK
ncbi:hypothetical protein JW916_14760 [Candidatus Sumerlaeota bacterium]|nr:hypothetical protein [Candidatus Sumerlaeota bacterium]